MANELLSRLRQLVDLNPTAEAAIRLLPVTRKSIARHRDLLKAPSSPRYLYVIETGWAAHYGVRPDGTRRITKIMLPGDFCGIHATSGGCLDHSVIALTNCEIIQIAWPDIETLIAEVPIIAKALWRSKLVDEALLRQWLLASSDTVKALARLLCELYVRADAAGLVKNGTCKLPMTQIELADALGRTAVHVNRTMRKLRSSGLINFSNNELTILNAREFYHTAQFDLRVLAPWKYN